MIKIKFTLIGLEAGGYIIPKDIMSPSPFSVGQEVYHYNSTQHRLYEVCAVRWVVDDCGGEFYQEVSLEAPASKK